MFKHSCRNPNNQRYILALYLFSLSFRAFSIQEEQIPDLLLIAIVLPHAHFLVSLNSDGVLLRIDCPEKNVKASGLILLSYGKTHI